MITRASFIRSRVPRRSAFTLIELLVVIAIIAALMALSASAVIKFIATQQVNNTQSTLDRTQSQLAKAWSKVKDQAQKETNIPANVELWIRSNLAGNDANATGRVRVIYVKLKLRQAFPMNFAEALNVPYTNPTLGTAVPASPLPPLPGYVSYLSSFGVTAAAVGAPGYVPQPYESSACLLMALQRGVSGAGIDPSELTKGGSTGNINGLPFLTDAWGTPIQFARFPAGAQALNPAGAQPGANDPGDPQGYLQMASWGTTFGPTYQALTLQVLAPPNSSFKLAPMVASGGLDKQVQFNPITFAPTNGADDLFSTP